MEMAVRQGVKHAVLTQLGWTLLYLATLGIALLVVLGMPELGARMIGTRQAPSPGIPSTTTSATPNVAR